MNQDIKYVFVDEISKMQEIFYKYLIAFKRMRPDIKFILSGDFDQHEPVCDRVITEYENSQALYELCDGNRILLSKCRRSDSELFDILQNLKLYDISPSLTTFDNKICSRAVCFTNKKRNEINDYHMKKLVKEKKKAGLKLSADPKDPLSQDVQLLANMPIICKRNFLYKFKVDDVKKSVSVDNNEEFQIVSISQSKNIIQIKNENKSLNILIDDFQGLFYVAFAITSHKAQGCTFNFPYSVYEYEKFNKRTKYVVLSRATKKEYINIMYNETP